MQQRKSKKIFFYFFLIIILGSINSIKINNFDLYKIKKIYVSGLDEDDNEIIYKNLMSLNLDNIFFLDKIEINKILDKNSNIEKFTIFKKYPSDLKIQIEKTKFLARINKNGKLYIVGSNGKLSKNNNLYQEIPFIFGKPKIQEFLEFKSILDKTYINYDEIKNLYFFQSGRWDIELKKNILLKLSKDISVDMINNILNFLNDNNFKNIKTIDARVINQIIIND